MRTTIKLTNARHEQGGEWFVTPEEWPNSAKALNIKKTLAECQSIEPTAGWHLQTRGSITEWQRMTL